MIVSKVIHLVVMTLLPKGQIDYKELGVRIKAALNRTERYREPVTADRYGSGSVLGFLSLRGGVGVSTLALNFAQFLSATGKQPAILIDLSLPVGSVSLWSGIIRTSTYRFTTQSSTI